MPLRCFPTLLGALLLCTVVAFVAPPAAADQVFTLQALSQDPVVGPPQPVPLTGPTATINQNSTSLHVSASIDTDPVSGWATGGSDATHRAVFQTSTPLTLGELGSQLNFTLDNQWGGAHVLGYFRLSATTDPNPTITSGATWTEIVPLSATALSGDALAILGDNAVRWVPDGSAPGVDTYSVSAAVDPSLDGITGFQLEALYDTSLPGSVGFPSTGPGLTSHGNFVLSDFAITASAISPPPLTPEPGSLVLLGTALGGLLFYGRRRRKV